MDKRALFTAAALLMTMPALAQAPSGTAGGADRPYVAPPSAADLERPDKTAAPGGLQPGEASVAAPVGEVLPVETASQIRADELIGKTVVGEAGEDLGSVDDIVLSKDGTVSGLVIKVGGVMGVGGKTVAVAWRDIAGAIGAETIKVPLTKDQLEKAPAFATREDQSQTSALPRLPGTGK